MKTKFLTILFIFIAVFSFAQFSGGSGTAADPYQISTSDDLDTFGESLHLNDSASLGTHYRLMNDIQWAPRRPPNTYKCFDFIFRGYFHGGGHTLELQFNEDNMLSFEFVFGYLEESAYIDSIYLAGNNGQLVCLVEVNLGTIYRCVNNMSSPAEIEALYYNDSFSLICGECYSPGSIIGCVNNVNITRNEWISGICHNSYGIIDSCINYGNISSGVGYSAGIVNFFHGGIMKNCINYGDVVALNEGGQKISGIAQQAINGSEISNCQNYGHVGGKGAVFCAGICANTTLVERILTTIDKCCNHGSIYGERDVSGICNGSDNPTSITNCLNTGVITGRERTAGICGDVVSNVIEVKKCLNIGKISGSAICDTVFASQERRHVDSCLYDKQMNPYFGGSDFGDVIGSAEGRLTRDLVGDTPELRAILGDGWSYANGRYPVPLGLENDSMALVSATPFYLKAVNNSVYEHVDSVASHFTVGTENGVHWDVAVDHLGIDDDVATLYSCGRDAISAVLGNYRRTVNVHIVDVPGSTTNRVIVATAGEHGQIDPADSVLVRYYDTQTFTVMPDEGYRIASVVVDTTDTVTAAVVAANGVYTFRRVVVDHTIEAAFAIKTYNINAVVVGVGGQIYPAGDTVVAHGSSVDFTIMPDEGYRIASVIVDTVNDVTAAVVNSGGRYTFTDVVADHTIEVTFEAIPTGIDEVVGSNVLFYPNPAASTLTIVGDTFVWAVVTDVAGRVLLTSRESTFYVGDLPSGVYFVEVHDAAGGVRMGQFVRK